MCSSDLVSRVSGHPLFGLLQPFHSVIVQTVPLIMPGVWKVQCGDPTGSALPRQQTATQHPATRTLVQFVQVLVLEYFIKSAAYTILSVSAHQRK